MKISHPLTVLQLFPPSIGLLFHYCSNQFSKESVILSKMNKKYILCVFAVLITITNSSYAFPASSKHMSKRALVPMSVAFNVPSEVGTSNTTGISVDDVNIL